MEGPWLASYIALWIIVALQGVAIFLLLRQLGIMYLGTAQGVARDGIAPGTTAPDFALPVLAGTGGRLDGSTASLAAFAGRPLVLVFGSSNCTPCRSLVPELNEFAADQRDALSVLFLCRGSESEARAFAEQTAITVPVAAHPDEDLSDKYKARVTPFAFVIDGEGVVRSKGLANNRLHLDALWEQARKHAAEESKTHGRNGTSHEHEHESIASESRRG
jgi:methylamine dehydrogenase accessory protein MauD